MTTNPAMRRILSIVLVAVVLSGCGQTSFVGSQFDNFTAYYNKFFNARKAFDRGLKSLERRDTRIDRDRYLPLFINPDAAASSADFQATIKKSADVLREHPSSKWVDDALLLIGKSYFYQRNYVGAEQKFLEVIALKTALEDEARFWLARTLITGGNFDEAALSLLESLNREEISRRWRPMLQLALGELNVERGDWESAADALSEGLESVRDNDLGARAQFLLGQIYETTGDYEKALAAYQRVERFRPLYELSYAAKLSVVRVEGSYLNEQAALRELRRMERDDKHYPYRNELAYVRGRIYQMQGHADDAFLLYDDILYDADGDVSAVRGRIHYALGELYRDVYRDFLTASAHFDTAATQLATRAAGPAAGATSRTLRYAPEAISDAAAQKETFASFSDVMFRINEMDSLLHLGSLDEEAFDEAILRIRQQLAEELEAQRRELERRQASQAFQDAGAAEAARARGGATAAAAAGSEAGFLYHRDPMLAEEARLSFQAVWGDRPLVPNWRRRDAVTSFLAAQTDDDDLDDTELDSFAPVDDALPVVDLSPIPRDSLSRIQMRADRAGASYELANVLFLSMNRPDSAAVWYRMVIDDAQDTTLIQRAYYALAEVHQSVGDSASARSLYESVIDIAPSTNLGRQISVKLGRAPATAADGDTLSLATRAYERAYSRWQIGNYRSALSEMIELAALYPETEVAPKALMAAGSIYAEWARVDSMDILGSLPVSVPDSLLEEIGLSVRKMQMVADTLAQSAPLEPVPDVVEEDSDEASVATSEEALNAEIDSPVAQPDEAPDSTAAADLAEQDGAPEAVPDSLADIDVAGVDERPAAEADWIDEAVDLPESDETEQAEQVAMEPDADESTPDAELAAAVDSILIEIHEPIDLERLYASVESRYADSPFASRASNIRAVLAERRQERAIADSITTAIADSLLRATLFPDLEDSIADPDPASESTDSLATGSSDVDAEPAEEALQQELISPGEPEAGADSTSAQPVDSTGLPAGGESGVPVAPERSEERLVPPDSTLVDPTVGPDGEIVPLRRPPRPVPQSQDQQPDSTGAEPVH